MSTCSPVADILWTLLRQLTIVSRTGYNDAGQGISSHELQLRDLPSKRLLGEGLAGIGYETEWKGERYARKEFVGVPSGIFREEAANLVGLEDHKNIVKTYGWTVDKRSCSLVLDFMDDDLLGLLLKRKEAKRNLNINVGSGTRYEPSHIQPFELPEALNVITEIAEGMKQLHDKKIEHGDLKTRNILVKYMNDSGDSNSLTSVKVADFGLVRTKRKSIFLVSPQARKLDMVQWKAPEYLSVLISLRKLEDKDETSSDSDSSSEENTALIRSGVDIRRLRSYDVFAADVYSFALTCSQILTGEDPYPNSNWKELVEKILNSNLRPTLLNAWPASLKELLQSCWDKDPSKRPTFSDIVQILQVIQDCEPTPSSSRIASGLLSTNVGNLDFKETPTKFPRKEDSEHTSTGTFSEDDKTGIEKRKDSRKSQVEAIQVPGTVSPFDASTSGIIVMSGTSKSRPKRRTPQAMEEPNNENSNLRNSTDYDVFLNYRGPDVKQTFVSHLDDALRRVGCHPFFDVLSIPKGSSIPDSINEALHGVLVHVAILSPGYAESAYCLNELCDMLASGKPLIPVFYGVKPEDLRWAVTKKGPFAKAFIHHLKRGWNEDVERWKRALLDVSMILGFISDDISNDMELLKKVVAAVLGLLPASFARPVLLAPHRVGLKNISMDVVNMLHKMGENVGVMGICGVGGIGKTTFVREVYNQMQLDFENRCFLEDVKDAKSVTDLQMKMVTDLLQVDVKKMHWDFAHWFEKIQKQKVLLVVDDISKREQFDELIVDVEKLAPGSRVLITSRESRILKSIMADVPQPQCALYDMPFLSYPDSQELFYQCVFQKKISDVVDDTFRVSQLVMMGNGLPLALEVIGGFLADRKNEPECWREALSALRESHGIISTLHIIYDGLQNDIDKCLFKDIACFMLGHSKHIVLEVWNSVGCGSSASGSLQRLIDKYLVKVDGKGQLRMHDLLRDMGREVVMNRAGHKFDCHSHIWNPSMAANILQKRHGLNEVLVALSVVGVDHHIASKAESYARMRALRYLSLDGYGVVGDFSGWSMELRWLQWRYMPFEELPSSLKLLNFVVLDLASSPCLTRVWARIEVPYNMLRVLILRECTKLEKLPQDIDKMLAKLKLLDLEGCSSLSSLPDSLGNLEELENLNLSSCSNLTILPNFSSLWSLQILKLNECKGLSKLPKSFGNSMPNLEELWLNGCELLQRLPSSFCQLRKLKYLNMKETALEELPKSFGQLLYLRRADFEGCQSLIQLPKDFGKLSSLEGLWLNGCDLIQQLPSSISGLKKLRVLDLKETALEELPEAFDQLQGLWKADFGGCKRLVELPESFGNLFNLEEVLLNGCELLQKLPSSLCNLTKLRVLNLKETALEELPEDFGNLESLRKVDFRGCKRLVELPESFGNLFNLEELWLEGCKLLQKLPPSFNRLTKLRVINLAETALEELPEDFGQLESLRAAHFGGCMSLNRLPDSFSALRNLEKLSLHGCELLQKLPLAFGRLENLVFLDMRGTGITDLPHDFGDLKSLMKANFEGCQRLVQLPESFGNLPNLEELWLNGCDLQDLPHSFSRLGKLRVLILSKTDLKKLPEDSGQLLSLRKAAFEDCTSLVELPESFGNLSNLVELRLNGCELLQSVPSSICTLTKVTVLHLADTALRELPKDFGELQSLKKADFGGCKQLVQLPGSFGKLSNIQELFLNGCELLQELSPSFCLLAKLMVLFLAETALVDLPVDFGQLQSLQEVHFEGCKRLVQLPESFGQLQNLKEAYFDGCKSLIRLPDSFSNLLNLEKVSLYCCELLRKFPLAFGRLKKLEFLDVRGTGMTKLPVDFGQLESLSEFYEAVPLVT